MERPQKRSRLGEACAPEPVSPEERPDGGAEPPSEASDADQGWRQSSSQEPLPPPQQQQQDQQDEAEDDELQESQWCPNEDGELEGELSVEDVAAGVQEILPQLTPTVSKAMAGIFLGGGSSAGGGGSEQALRRRRPAACSNPKCPRQGQPAVVAGVGCRSGSRQRELEFQCACTKRLFTLAEGACVRWGNKYGILQRLAQSERSKWKLHVQFLSRTITLAAWTDKKGEEQKSKAELISTGRPGADPHVFMLTSQHKDLAWEEFARSWERGEAYVLPEQPVVLYSPPGGPRDFLAVPQAAPKYTCCGCGCSNLWDTSHRACKSSKLPAASSHGSFSTSRTSSPGPAIGQGAGGGGLRTGDWVWVQPADGSYVDQCLQLGRVLSTHMAQGRAAPPVKVLLFARADSVEGACYSPTGGTEELPAARLATQPDPFDLPGVKILRQDGSQEALPPAPEAPPVQICDLFCGYGGLSVGLEQSGVGQTRWAVDVCEPALKTFAGCHPHAATYLMTVSEFLVGVKEGREGYPRPVAGVQGPLSPSLLPLRDEPLLVQGGPPCQGFSLANKAGAEAKMAKNVLVLVMLAVVETLMPEYVVIENVVGILWCEGMVEGILTTLVSLGYQVRWRVVNCGGYGLATHRRRVIINAARAKVPLPQFPEYSHVFNAGGYSAAQPEAGCSLAARKDMARRRVPLRWLKHVKVPCNAPLPRLTVRAVIGDLPEELAPGGEVEYARPPTSFYQAQARGALARVTDHEVFDFKERNLERCALVPKEGQPPPAGQARWEGACAVTENPLAPAQAGDWRDLPAHALPRKLLEKLQEWRARGGKPEYVGMFGRLLWGGQFSTLLTTPSLHSSTTTCFLHPSADRPLTVREAARVQGIPDGVRFEGDKPEDKHRQVGNSVPVPLGAALGRELKRALQRRAAGLG